ncbi:hypothetical protein ADEAN_000211600 [Angomonas deanei]|uniref:Uncharacterized protein n=1 Tax=Angomonas deanei TaxID=59799 RepID=A0A7G2C592_9TRYP|nr:hypothetical protein ADEAN_000211600 [Angomonas deanei]
MEGLHQRLFSENEAMVERFKEAINGVGQSLSLNDAAPILQSADHSTLSDQLRSLTQEIIRLQSELKTVKTTNIVLESQLAQRIDAAQREANLRSLESATAPFPSQDVTSGGGATAANRPETPKLVENVASPSSNVLPSSNAQPASPAPTAVRESANVEMLTGIIRDQAAMIESLRNREMLLSEQFNQEKEKNVLMAKQVDTDRVREMEKNTTMDLVSSVTKASEPALVGELRAQLVACQQELSMTKEMLAAERNNARSVQIDAAELKSRLDGLQSEISYQQINTDRSKSLVALNEELQKDVNTLKEHNDKLMLASNLLRQKLMDEAQKGGEAARQGRHEIALAQRMGSIQGEALEQMKALEQRVRTFQKELKEKVSNEETIVSKNEDAQRLIFKLHNQLRAKDREIAELKAQRYSHPGQQTHSAVSPPPPQATHRGMQTLSITSPHKLSSPQEESSPSTSAERDSPRPAVSYSKPKVAEAPVKEEDALLQPQIAAIVQREVERNQRENLFQISSLRSSVNRLEKDLAAAREQISSGKSGSKTVRQQLADLRSEKENMEKQHAFELARALRLKAESDAELSRYRANAEKQSTTRSGDPWALVDKLEARIRELESRPQGGLSHYESTTTSPVSPEHLPSAKDVRNHTKIVMQLESALDDLRHKIEVDTPKTENILRFEMAMLKQSLRRLATDLALTKNVGVDSIMRIYGCPSSAGDQNEESLRAEILKKANEVLELKFKTESLNLTVRRLTRHLDTLMQTDSERQTPKDRTQQDQVEVLETVIANLKLVVEKLQAENVLLRKQSKTQTGSGKRWQRESQDVDIGGPRTKGRYNPTGPSTSQEVELRRKLLTAQATAEQYQAELEELRRSMDPERANASSPSVRQWLPTSPPPLPEAPYALRSQETGQRRLSRGDTSASHESMSHHHV